MSTHMEFVYTVTRNRALPDAIVAAALATNLNSWVGVPTGMGTWETYIGTVQRVTIANPSLGVFTITLCVAFNAQFLALCPLDANQNAGLVNFFLGGIQQQDKLLEVTETARTNLATCVVP